MTTRPALLSRLGSFLRSALLGGAATLADLGVIAFAVGILGVSPKAANVPALLVGAIIQFIGSRHFAFGGARSGSLRKQALLFAATEVVALVLNAALYHAVASAWPLGTATAVLARAVTTNLVFVCWSYPAWRRVFAGATADPRHPA